MAVSEGWLWTFRAGVGFILLAALLFLLGFATDHWHSDDTSNYGLWEECTGATCSGHDSDELPAYHVVTQAFQVMAATFFALSPIIHFFFYCSKKDRSSSWKTRIFDIGYSIGIAFHAVSVIVFGLEHPHPSDLAWSFSMSASALAIGLIGITLVIISRKKALQDFGFMTGNKKRGHRRIGTLHQTSRSSDSRSGTPLSTTRNSVGTSNNTLGPSQRNPSLPAMNLNVHVHPSSPRGDLFQTASSSVPYGQTPYSNYPSSPSPMNPYPYGPGPAYPPLHNYPSTSRDHDLGPLRGSGSRLNPSAPVDYDLPPYSEAVTPTDNSHQRDPSYDQVKSDNWVG